MTLEGINDRYPKRERSEIEENVSRISPLREEWMLVTCPPKQEENAKRFLLIRIP